MSDHLVRVGHLKSLQRAKEWTDSELARNCGRSPQQVRSWFLPVGAKGFRQIGEKLARLLEESLGLARYALDSRPSNELEVREPLSTAYSDAASRIAPNPVKKQAREMPLLKWAQLTTMLSLDNVTLRSRAPHLESFASASRCAKFVEVQDDSMAPDYAPGDHVLLDPNEAPRAGDIVLLKLPSGELFLRVFTPRTAHLFDGVAINAHYQAVSSATDSAEVIAVMVEHRRYRRR